MNRNTSVSFYHQNNYLENMKFRHLLIVIIIGSLIVGCDMSYEKRLQQCDSVGEFREGYALCLQDGKYFFIDENGKQRSKKYDEAEEFANGYAIVRNNYKDDRFQIIILNKEFKEKYYSIYETFGNVNPWGKLWVKMNTDILRIGWMLLDVETGSLKLSSVGKPDCVTDDGTTVISRLHKRDGSLSYYEYAIYDGQGNEVVPFGKYSYIGNFSAGMAQYSTTGYFFFAGAEHISFSGYNDNKARLSHLPTLQDFPSKDVKLGYIDTKGTIVCPERFNTATPFNEAGYASVSVLDSNSWGTYYDFFDGADRYIINTKFEDCTGDIIAKASFLPDGEWKFGKSSAGEFLLANNEGETVSLGFGCDFAECRGYIMTRNGTRYELYEKNELIARNATPIASFVREKSGELVVQKLTWDEQTRSSTTTICFFDQTRQRGFSWKENPYDEYLMDGTYINSGWEHLYCIDKTWRPCFSTFSFQ